MTKQEKIKWLQSVYNKYKYPIDEINLFGIRDAKNQTKDVINDYLGFFTNNDFFMCKGTTDPGVYWVENKIERNKLGTFHLNEAFHEKIWCIGVHKGYEALVNNYKYCKPTKGWRDGNYNYLKDSKDIEVCDYFGINFHRMNESLIAKVIGKYSGGCQVVQSNKDFRFIIDAVKSTKTYTTNKNATFNYMLFNINEIPDGFIG